jgi:hypothetical protein
MFWFWIFILGMLNLYCDALKFKFTKGLIAFCIFGITMRLTTWESRYFSDKKLIWEENREKDLGFHFILDLSDWLSKTPTCNSELHFFLVWLPFFLLQFSVLWILNYCFEEAVISRLSAARYLLHRNDPKCTYKVGRILMVQDLFKFILWCANCLD